MPLWCCWDGPTSMGLLMQDASSLRLEDGDEKRFRQV